MEKIAVRPLSHCAEYKPCLASEGVLVIAGSQPPVVKVTLVMGVLMAPGKGRQEEEYE
jgi:hypothetical protein